MLTGEGATSVTLAWTPSTDNVGVTGYSIYWIYTTGHSGRGGGTTTHTILLGSTNGSTPAITIGGLAQNQTYSLYVQATDAAGNLSGLAGPSYVIPGATPYNLGITTVSSTPSPTAPAYTLNDVANHPWTIQVRHEHVLAAHLFAGERADGDDHQLDDRCRFVDPPASSVGTTTVTYQVANQFGAAQSSVALYVSADVPVPGFVFTNTSSPTFDLVGYSISLQITDASNTPSTYSVVTGPAGMTIDPVTGVVNWIPTQAGNPQVTFQLTNSAGTATISLGPVIAVASPPQDVAITGTNGWSPILSWTPPLYNSNLVASYRIMINGPDFLNENFTTSGPVTSTSLWLGDNPGAYQVNMQALDASGNQGDWNTSLTFNYNPVLPNPYYQITSNGGAATGTVGQPVTIQLYDLNTAMTSTFSLVSGPVGMTVDPNTGLVTWTPTQAQLGTQSMTFRLTNGAGTADESLTMVVSDPSTTPLPDPGYGFFSNGGYALGFVGQPVSGIVYDMKGSRVTRTRWCRVRTE